MMLRLMLASSLLLVAACNDARPLPERGLGSSTPRVPAAPPERLPVPDELEGTPAHPQPVRPVRVTETVQHPAPAPDRDYAAELRPVIENPIGCVPADERGSFPPSVTVRASVQVFDDGRVNRPTVSASGLSAGVIACLTERVARFRFRAPVEPAPRTVSATVTFERRGDAQQVQAAEAARVAQAAEEARLEVARRGAPPTSGQWVAGPNGQPVQGAPSQAIDARRGAELAGPDGQRIGGPSGTMIEGPQGQPIGQ